MTMRVLLALLLFAAAALPASAQNDWMIVPGLRVGPIRADSSEAGLVAAFGRENVRTQPFNVGEGETAPGYAIFPDTPWEFWVRLTPDGARVASVRVQGTGGPWRTETGFRLGLTLAQVERFNERPFKVTGMGWDYAGVVTSWEGGALPEELTVFFAPSRRAPQRIEERAMGSEPRSSQDEALRAVGYRVHVIQVELR
jgi:hypothetical protein